MKAIGKFVMASGMLAALAGCGSPQDEPAAAPTGEAAPAVPAAAADARPASFAQCVACHAVEQGKHGIGPSLAGVYGTKVGEVEGYAFSPALLASGLTWDDATLDKWLANPRQLVPGNKMTYAGMADPAKRAELIAYMKTLK